MVGVTGFEPAAFRSQSGRATKLRHTPSPRGAVRRFGAVRAQALTCAALSLGKLERGFAV